MVRWVVHQDPRASCRARRWTGTYSCLYGPEYLPLTATHCEKSLSEPLCLINQDREEHGLAEEVSTGPEPQPGAPPGLEFV